MTRWPCLGAMCLVISAQPVAAAEPPDPDSLRLASSEALEPLLLAWTKAYEAQKPDRRILVRPAKGASASALDALLDGELDAVVIGRPLRPGEGVAFAARFGGPPQCVPVATPAPRGEQRSTLGVLVHPANPLRAVSVSQLDAIFSSERRRGDPHVATWGALGLDGEWSAAPVRPVAPDVDAGTSQYVREHVLWGASYASAVRQVPALSDSVVRAVAADPHAIGITTLNFGTRGVKVLAVADGAAAVEPTDEHVASHRYPLTRWVDVCLAPAGPTRAVDFVKFALSSRGQRIASESGFLRLTPPGIHVSNARLVPQAPRSGSPYTLPILGIELAWMAPGELMLGSPDDEPSRGVDEGPQVRVALTKGFWIGRTEVTQREWHAVMGTNPSRFVGATRPVEQVSWRQASEFARRIDARERAAGRVPAGYRYALPTEAQWEYAAKAGATGAFSMNVDDYAWHDQNSGGTTRAVAMKRANAWGLHDMLGNVWEWCADWHAPYPGGAIADYAGPTHGTAKASRGGSWWAGPRGARPANRYRDMQQNGNDDLGFRLALVPADSQGVAAVLPDYQPEGKVAGKLSLAGTDGMTGMVERWAERFRVHHPAVEFQITGGEPPSAGAALVNGTALIGYTGRTLWEPEVERIKAARGRKPLTFRIGAATYDHLERTTTMAVFVHADNPLRQMTLEQVEAIFADGAAMRWSELGAGGAWADRPIRAISAKLATGATNHVRDFALGGKPWSPRVTEFPTDQEAIAALADDPYALCVAALPFRTSAVRALALGTSDGAGFHAPTFEHVVTRRYPLARLLYAHAMPPSVDPWPAVAVEFVRFVYSAEGQRIVDESGYLPLTPEIALAELAQLPAPQPRAGATR